jgi:hypothetical protein
MIKYEDAVKEGKELVERLDRGRWIMGYVAHRVDKIGYRSETAALRALAEKSGIEFTELKRYRNVYRAWRETMDPHIEGWMKELDHEER